MLEKFKTYNRNFKDHEFKQAIDLSNVSTVYDNGNIIDIVMETGEKIQVIREGFTYDEMVDRVNAAKMRRHGC